MALAGIVIRVVPNSSDAIEQIRAFDCVVDIQPTPDNPACLAIVVESPAERLKNDLEKLKDQNFVLTLDIASINYEDDIEKNGMIPPIIDQKSDR